MVKTNTWSQKIEYLCPFIVLQDGDASHHNSIPRSGGLVRHLQSPGHLLSCSDPQAFSTFPDRLRSLSVLSPPLWGLYKGPLGGSSPSTSGDHRRSPILGCLASRGPSLLGASQQPQRHYPISFPGSLYPSEEIYTNSSLENILHWSQNP